MEQWLLVIETKRDGEQWVGTVESVHLTEDEAEACSSSLDDGQRAKTHLRCDPSGSYEAGDRYQNTTRNYSPRDDFNYLT
jgi:hypothetical protein